MENKSLIEQKIGELLESFSSSLVEKREEISALIQKSDDIIALVEPLDEIGNEAGSMLTQKYSKEIRDTHKLIEEIRKTITKPLDDAKKHVMKFVNDPKDRAKDTVKKLRKLVLDWEDKQKAIRDEEERIKREKIAEEQRKLRIAQEMQDSELAKEQADKIEFQEESIKDAHSFAPIVDKRSFKRKYKARVVDIMALPDEYTERVADMTKLNLIAKDSEGKAIIPGVIFEEVE